MITSYSLPGEDVNIEVTENTRKIIQAAIKRYERLAHENDFIGKKFYDKHLGIKGTSELLTDDTFKYRIAVISEFGEELKPWRRESIQILQSEINKTYPDRIIVTGDVGTRVKLKRLNQNNDFTL